MTAPREHVLDNFYMVKEASKEKALKDLSMKALRKKQYRRLAGLDQPIAGKMMYEPGYFTRQHLKKLRR